MQQRVRGADPDHQRRRYDVAASQAGDRDGPGLGHAGGWISREINAKKEREIHYVETVCLVRKPGQKFIVQLVGFAGVKEAALVAEFEAACKTVQIVEP